MISTSNYTTNYFYANSFKNTFSKTTRSLFTQKLNENIRGYICIFFKANINCRTSNLLKYIKCDFFLNFGLFWFIHLLREAAKSSSYEM